MFYQKFEKYIGKDFDPDWNQMLLGFDKYLNTYAQPNSNAHITISHVAENLRIKEELATILLSIAHNEQILVRQFTIFNPEDEFVINSFIEPKELPNEIYDLRDMSVLTSDEYMVELSFLFPTKLDSRQYNFEPT